MAANGRSSWAALLCLLLAQALPARADQPKGKPSPPRAQAEDFWLDDARRAAAAAAQVVGVPDPLTALVLRAEGKRMLVWGAEPDEEPEGAPPLNPKLLAVIPDKRALPDLRNRPKEEWTPAEVAEYEAYCQAVKNAATTAPQLFAKSARENEDVTWGHLFREPWKYRGKVIHMEGVLKRLRREDAPRCAWVTTIYEGWVFVDTPGANPISVIVPVLPQGLKPGESVSHRVSFDGYFFKRYRYVSGKGPRDTLLFIAPTFHTTGLAPAKTTDVGFGDFPASLVLSLAGLLGVTVAVILGLAWWFRRGDRKIHSRLSDVRASMFAAPEGSEPEPPSEVTGIRADPPPRHSPRPGGEPEGREKPPTF